MSFPEPPEWFKSQMFANAVCGCNRPNPLTGTIKHGFYCDRCWKTVEKKQTCDGCSVSLTETHLFATLEEKRLCRTCFEKGKW